MTGHGASHVARETSQLDAGVVGRHLGRLAAAYPAFRFSYETYAGHKSAARWVAERREGTASGLRVVITDDLMELYAALARDEARSEQSGQVP